MQIRISKRRVALAALFVLAGVGLGSLLSPLVGTALATVGTVANISDNSASAYFAKVSSDGKLAVGDGAGPLSVDGTVASRPAAPASPWSSSTTLQADLVPIAGPSAAPINVTSFSFSWDAPSGYANLHVYVYSFHVPSSATTCSTTNQDGTIWQIHNMGVDTPYSFTFPTPLQFKPPANTKACLYANAPSYYDTTMNAVGFYGG